MIERVLWMLVGGLSIANGVMFIAMADKSADIGNWFFAAFAALAGLAMIGVGMWLIAYLTTGGVDGVE